MIESNGYLENLKKHLRFVEEDHYEELGDALIYTNEVTNQYFAGKLYKRPAGDYALISDEFEITCLMKEIHLINTEIEEIFFKLLGKGWYFKKEDGIFVARHIIN